MKAVSVKPNALSLTLKIVGLPRANLFKSFWIARDRKWMKENPYTIAKETGLSLEHILLILKREPDAKMYTGGTVLDAYEAAGQWIAFEMMDPDFRDRMVERGKRLKRHSGWGATDPQFEFKF